MNQEWTGTGSGLELDNNKRFNEFSDIASHAIGDSNSSPLVSVCDPCESVWCLMYHPGNNRACDNNNLGDETSLVALHFL